MLAKRSHRVRYGRVRTATARQDSSAVGLLVGRACVFAAVGVVLAAGCGASADSPAHATRLTVDEKAGTVAGVGLGDSRARLERTFGPGKDTTDTGGVAVPRGADHDAIGSPNSYGFPRPCRRRPAGGSPSPRSQGLLSLSYSYVAFELCDGRVYEFVTTGAGARTVEGVAIGRSLRAAKRAYPRLRCGTSTGDSTDPPTPLYPYCSGRVGPDRYLWFGQNPIRSIAIASVRLGG
jgi:hypothetical protein